MDTLATTTPPVQTDVTLLSETLVPNGTRSLEDPEKKQQYHDLLSRYRGYAKASAENIVKMAETLYQAKESLSNLTVESSRYTFPRFCEDVGLDPKGSTCRKFLVIGQEATRFYPFLDRLPNNWTTVYRLANMDKEEFDGITKHKLFSTTMTANDMKEASGKEKAASGTKPDVEHELVIELIDLEDAEKLEAYDKIKSLEDDYRFTVQVAGELKKLVEARYGQ